MGALAHGRGRGPGAIRRAARTLHAGVHITFVVDADVEDLLAALGRARKRLEAHVRSAAVARQRHGHHVAAAALVEAAHPGQHRGGVGQKRMKYRHLGAGEAVVADRAHARDAAGRCRHHHVRADAPQGVAHDQFCVAALAARQSGCEQVLEIADFIVDARSPDVFQRAGGAGFHAGRVAVAHIALDHVGRNAVVDDAAVGAAHGAQQAIDALRSVPADHAAAGVFRERARGAVEYAFRIAALAAEREFEAFTCRHDLDARLQLVVGLRLGPRAGAHAVVAAVAGCGLEMYGLVRGTHDDPYLQFLDINARAVSCGERRKASFSSPRSMARKISSHMMPGSNAALTPKMPARRLSLSTILR